MGGERKPRSDGQPDSTIKRCMPVFDAITNGYIITTYVDIWVEQEQDDFPSEHLFPNSTTDTHPYFQWPSFKPIEFHIIEQAPTHPDRGSHKVSFPKLMNPWGIKTPPGYSCLFVPPLHRDSLFTILPGVVDTDEYNLPVNFPFMLKNADSFRGLIPAGTPMAQVIPFKRDEWKMNLGNEEDLKNIEKKFKSVRTTFYDGYKTKFRKKKEYK
jgi:hypothetical protein